MADRQVRQQRPAEHLEHTQHDPAWPTEQQASPPASPVLRRSLGHEAQVVRLFAHLRDQRDAHRHRGTEQGEVELTALPVGTGIARQVREQVRVVVEHIDIRHDHQHQPERLRPHLQAADRGDAIDHQRDHRQRADQVAPGRRDVECQLKSVGHDGRLEREKNEGEARVDQRGDGRADVAETGAAREQIHVDAVACGVMTDRQTGQEDDQPGREDGPERIDEAVLDQQRGADRLKHQERRCTERRVGHPQRRPLAETARREAQRIVLHRLARDPAVVVATHLDDALHRFAARSTRHRRDRRAERRLRRDGALGGGVGGRHARFCRQGSGQLICPSHQATRAWRQRGTPLWNCR